MLVSQYPTLTPVFGEVVMGTVSLNLCTSALEECTMKSKHGWIKSVLVSLMVIVIVGLIGVVAYSETIKTQKMNELKNECASLSVDNATLRYLLNCSKDPALLTALVMKIDNALNQDTLRDILGEEWDGTPETATAMFEQDAKYCRQALAVVEQQLLGSEGVDDGPQSRFDPNDPGYADFGGGINH